MIGQNGVEGTYDNWLRGQDGSEARHDRRDRHAALRPGRAGGALGLPPAPDDRQDGAGRGAAGARRRRQARTRATAPTRASLIAMDAQTGALRAIASYPNFNPNWFVAPNLKANRGHLRYLETSKTTPAAEPRDHGPVSRRVDVQAVHGDRRRAVRRAAEHLRHDPVQRQGQDRGAHVQQLGSRSRTCR